MKVCTKCKEQKDLNLFSRNKSKKSGYNSWCKKCVNIITGLHYRENKRSYFVKKKIYMEERREKMFSFLLNNPCVRCGIRNPLVLEFNHLRDKSNNISLMLSKGQNRNNILNEIKKCEVLCSNCHKLYTAKQQGRYKNIEGIEKYYELTQK